MTKPLPMPVELVVNHPEVIPLANHAYHGVLTLAVAYWRSECRPMPTTAKDLAAMARMDLRSWSAHGKAIVRCLNIVYPIIQRRMVDEVSNMQARRERAIKASAAAHAPGRQARGRQNAIHPAPSPPDEPTSLPTHAPRHTSGKVDLAARGASKARHEAYGKVGGAPALSDVDARAGVGGDGRLGQSPTGLIGNTPDTAYSDWNWEPTPTPPPLVEQE